MIFALAGNQNCGKTTLFNQLTGSNQHVGNFPGVTVDQKSGEVRGQKGCTVVDLPGIYSIRPYTPEEIVTRDFILNQKLRLRYVGRNTPHPLKIKVHTTYSLKAQQRGRKALHSTAA